MTTEKNSISEQGVTSGTSKNGPQGLNGHQISKHFYSPVFRISSAPASVVDSVVAFEDTFFELLSAGGLGVGEVIGTSSDSIRLIITRLLTESLSRRYIFSC